jgi:hypothetical protein
MGGQIKAVLGIVERNQSTPQERPALHGAG